MGALFEKILSMSLSATWVVLIVVVLRQVLKKAPKWVRCLLWAMVAVRLACPVSLESSFSLMPEAVSGGNVVISFSEERKAADQTFSRIPSRNQADATEALGDSTGDTYTAAGDGWEEGISAEDVLPYVWILGMAVMAVYAAASFGRLKKKVAPSVALTENIRLCDYIDSPFILGIRKPVIYLPSNMRPDAAAHVLAHEKAHLKRRDHWWKPLGFALLTVHWFNPAMWLAYILLCRDIELACDEKVVREMRIDEKKAYSEALLACSVPRKMIAACPLAFGEVGVKERVRSVLNYKKPAFWIIVLAVVLCAVAAVCLLTDPVTEDGPFGRKWYAEDVVYRSAAISYQIEAEDLPGCYLKEDGTLLVLEDAEQDTWAQAGVFADVVLTEENFDDYVRLSETWSGGLSAETLRKENKKAWVLYTEDGDGSSGTHFCYLLQQKNGEIYMTSGIFWGENDQGCVTSIQWILRLSGEKSNSTVMDATVLQVSGGTLLVEPVAGSWERSSADQIWVSLRNGEQAMPDVRVGDQIRVRYDGMIAESYPAQINGAESISITGRAISDEIHGQILTALEAESVEYFDTQTVDGYQVVGCQYGEELALVYLAKEEDGWKLASVVKQKYLNEYIGQDAWWDDGIEGKKVYLINNTQISGLHISGDTDEFIYIVNYPALVVVDAGLDYEFIISGVLGYVAYIQDYASIRIPVPEGWEYEVREYTDDSTPFGIAFRPEGEEGWVSVEFRPEGFSVCGTGLVVADGMLRHNKYVFGMGFYDGSDAWSYMHFADLPGTYVAINEGADGWLKERDDEVMDILGRMALGENAMSWDMVYELARTLIRDESYSDITGSFDYHTGVWSVEYTNAGHKVVHLLTVDSEGNVTAP